MKLLYSFALSSFFLMSGPVQADLVKLKDPSSQKALIQALLTSGAKTGGKVGYKTISVREITFERTDGVHFRLTESSAKESHLKEEAQLYQAIQDSLVAQLNQDKKSVGDCSAGHCEQSWKQISCRWKLKSGKKVDTFCSASAEINPL